MNTLLTQALTASYLVSYRYLKLVQAKMKSLDHKQSGNSFDAPWKKDPEKKKELDWGKRHRIIIGTAEGLEYLHKGCEVRIIHRDIKASNILLDLKYRPKIADFGLARLCSRESDKNSLVNNSVAGTL